MDSSFISEPMWQVHFWQLVTWLVRFRGQCTDTGPLRIDANGISQAQRVHLQCHHQCLSKRHHMAPLTSHFWHLERLYGSSMFILQVASALEGSQWSLALHLSTSIPSKSCSLASLNAASSGMTNASLDISPQNQHVYPPVICSMRESFVDIYFGLARKLVFICADNAFMDLCV